MEAHENQQWNQPFHWNHQFQWTQPQENAHQEKPPFMTCKACSDVTHDTDHCPLIYGPTVVTQGNPKQQWNPLFQGNPQFQPYQCNTFTNQSYEPQYPPIQDFNQYQPPSPNYYQEPTYEQSSYEQPQPPPQSYFQPPPPPHSPQEDYLNNEQYPQQPPPSNEHSLQDLQNIITTLLHDQIKMQAQLNDLIASQTFEDVPTEEPDLECHEDAITLEEGNVIEESSMDIEMGVEKEELEQVEEEELGIEEKLMGEDLVEMVKDEGLNGIGIPRVDGNDEGIGNENEKKEEEEKVYIPKQEPITPCNALVVIPNDTVSFDEDEKPPPIHDLFEVVDKCLLGLGLTKNDEKRTHGGELSQACVVMMEPLKQELFEMAHHGLVGKMLTKKVGKRHTKKFVKGDAKKKFRKKHTTLTWDNVVKDMKPNQAKSRSKLLLDLKRYAFGSVRKKKKVNNAGGVMWEPPFEKEI